ncbi:MAG: VOC family protein [Rhodobacteraceae bacterium]|nr:VOC family protein [Paracoccaceae bacterium]
MDPTEGTTGRLPDGTHLGEVTLRVRDVAASLGVWRDIMGLSVLEASADSARLGVGGRTLVALRGGAADPATAPVVGLFHVAVHVTSRAALAGMLWRLRQAGRPHSGQDHTISDSLYLTDDDGNGIEIAHDTPGRGRVEVSDGMARAVRNDGRILSVVEPLDLGALSDAAPDGHPARREMPGDSFIGHIHFRTNRRERAFGFYTQVLGFRPNGNAPAFSFCDVGTSRRGHMIAFNSWAGEALPAAAPGAPGVERFVIRVPDRGAITAAADRLRDAGAPVTALPEGLMTEDPDGNRVVLAATGD